jgi:23S rRNA 5-hydroxycytidine C2501 synthase
MSRHSIELLSPAKDSSTGIAAIDHGADAVYIGAPRFGARAAAGNTIDEIKRLIDYAHGFHARVYVALNTLLTDDELGEAVAIAHQVHEIGADALIIQDMGLLECDLPPLPLHASTQCDNRTREKVRFLEDVGFTQVVLARELSLAQIKEIRAATSVPLEFFVHGALCVSYSGRCRISEILAGRSADRGECAQFCRHRYTLKDAAGNILKKDSHLLSLKDLDLRNHLQGLLDAGIRSFKIEGRLKDINYVKNVTAAYRLALDAIIAKDGGLRRSSSGRCTFAFSPDPARTFNRGSTEYFLYEQRNRVGSIESPKSTGQEIGVVTKVQGRFVEIDTREVIVNGDGLCYFDDTGALAGLRVNKVEGPKIFFKGLARVRPGTVLYRNLDRAFNRQLQNSTGCRKIPVTLTMTETVAGLGFTIVDDDGCRSSLDTPLVKKKAENQERMRNVLIQQVKKSGKTIFSVSEVRIAMEPTIHLPVSQINDIRRMAFDAHLRSRQLQHEIRHRPVTPNTLPWPADQPPPFTHVSNRKAQEFFARHGLSIPPETNNEKIVLMTCRYCLKHQLGLCSAIDPQAKSNKEPLTLTDNTGTYELSFDCRRCEMSLLLQNPGKTTTESK